MVPKGVAHCTAGYLLWTSMTVRTVFDLHVGDCYASVADIGWITGHSYVIYGPLFFVAGTVVKSAVVFRPVSSRWRRCEPQPPMSNRAAACSDMSLATLHPLAVAPCRRVDA